MSGNIKGVTFGDIHTSSFGAYLSKTVIGEPPPKVYKADIPGGHGSLDLTDYFGETKFENRTLTFTFTFPQKGSSLLEAYSAFQNALHGRYFDRIIPDGDSLYRYIGRVTVGELKKEKMSRVNVECDCLPYKYSSITVSETFNVNGVEFPEGYGDINDDGVIDASDRSLLSALRGKRTFECEEAVRADLDFDGIVSTDDYNAMRDFVNAAGTGTVSEFKNFIGNDSGLALRNSRKKRIDFGPYPVQAEISIDSGSDITVWELRVDNITRYIGGKRSFSLPLSGVREVMILTVNTDRTGSFTLKYPDAASL